MKNVLTAIAIAFGVSAGVAAQQQPAPAPAPGAAPAPRPAQAQRPAPAPAPAPAIAAPAKPGTVEPVLPAPQTAQPNIRFDIAITDDGAGAPAVRKNLVLMVQGNGKASLRSQGLAPAAGENKAVGPMPAFPPGGMSAVFLNIDVTAMMGPPEPGKVRSRIMVEYQPYLANVPTLPASVRAQVDVILESGRKVQIWQTADPVSDRHSSIEVTATVLK